MQLSRLVILRTGIVDHEQIQPRRVGIEIQKDRMLQSGAERNVDRRSSYEECNAASVDLITDLVLRSVAVEIADEQDAFRRCFAVPVLLIVIPEPEQPRKCGRIIPKHLVGIVVSPGGSGRFGSFFDLQADDEPIALADLFAAVFDVRANIIDAG